MQDDHSMIVSALMENQLFGKHTMANHDYKVVNEEYDGPLDVEYA